MENTTPNSPQTIVSAADLKREAEELKALLAETKALAREVKGPKKPRAIMTDEERRNAAKSAWGKSGTKRRSPADVPTPTPGGQHEQDARDFTISNLPKRNLHKADLGYDKVDLCDDVIRVERFLESQAQQARKKVKIEQRLKWIREDMTESDGLRKRNNTYELKAQEQGQDVQTMHYNSANPTEEDEESEEKEMEKGKEEEEKDEEEENGEEEKDEEEEEKW